MDIHWRNTQKPIRFFFMDARVFSAIFLFLIHIRWWTLGVSLAAMALFWFLERKGLTFAASLRAFRAWILGRHRPANKRRAIKRWVDFG